MLSKEEIDMVLIVSISSRRKTGFTLKKAPYTVHIHEAFATVLRANHSRTDGKIYMLDDMALDDSVSIYTAEGINLDDIKYPGQVQPRDIMDYGRKQLAVGTALLYEASLARSMQSGNDLVSDCTWNAKREFEFGAGVVARAFSQKRYFDQDTAPLLEHFLYASRNVDGLGDFMHHCRKSIARRKGE